MSAITGIFFRDGRTVPEEQIKKMNDRLSHRGPDGSSTWCEGPVGLGHQMLWTTPESLHETLPFEEDGLVITADARIDNRKELSQKLKIEDKEEVSDSYFILKAYQKWGEKCSKELLGDFAFAIWDKDKEKLFCARDHMGVKPFYYYLDDEMFVFGTEIKALFCVSEVPHELNERRLALFLTLNDFFEKEATFYENINTLRAAHTLTVNEKGTRINRYWKLDYESQIIMNSEGDYANKFLEIFNESVRCRLRSHGHIGVMLSGGLDSSSVTCIAKKIFGEIERQENIHSFSFVFDDFPESDERHYIKRVLGTGGIESYFINCDGISPLEDINEILDCQDQPISSFQVAMVHNLGKLIQEDGLRVLLTGEGGDQIVSHGEKYLEELLITFQWRRMLNDIKNISKINNRNGYRVLAATILHVVQYYLMKWPQLYYFLKRDNNILNKNFLRIVPPDKYIKLRDKAQTIISSKNYHYFQINTISHQKSFEIMDQGYAGFSIETRNPFFDKRLIEFCYAIPTEMKIKSGYGRYILRIAMEGILPEEVQWRTTKANIAGASIRNFLAEKKILEKVANDKDEIIGNYVNLASLNNAFKNFSRFKPSISALFLWRVILFYLWKLKFNKIKS